MQVLSKRQNVAIEVKKGDFICPQCDKVFSDDKDKTYSRNIDRSVDKTVKMTCSCGGVFFITKNFNGDFSTFRLNSVKK